LGHDVSQRPGSQLHRGISRRRRVVVDELDAARRLGVRPCTETVETARERLNDVWQYRAPTRTHLIQPPRRDFRAESLLVLREWSREHAGPLACTAYVQWRREHPSAPTRNTINPPVRRLVRGARRRRAGRPRRTGRQTHRRRGSAAGAAPRATSAGRRRGSAIRSEHGRQPRAIEFFRWRLAAAPETPTQATVYNLFPGGWNAVLAASAV
jgi:hypothetical protein